MQVPKRTVATCMLHTASQGQASFCFRVNDTMWQRAELETPSFTKSQLEHDLPKKKKKKK